MDAAAFRAEFPVLETTAYLNAGTDGPLPASAVEDVREHLEAELTEGRATPHFLRRFELMDELRHGYSRVLGCAVEDVALTTSTSEGIGAVLAGLDLGPGDEIVSSDQEHPGLLGPLRAARDRGADVRLVAPADLADAVGPRTAARPCVRPPPRTSPTRSGRAPAWSRARTCSGSAARSRRRRWPSSRCP